jgi:hypothetical protein
VFHYDYLRARAQAFCENNVLHAGVCLIYHRRMNIKSALKRAGSVTALARVLQVTRQAAQQYQARGLSKKAKRKLADATTADWARAFETKNTTK